MKGVLQGTVSSFFAPAVLLADLLLLFGSEVVLDVEQCSDLFWRFPLDHGGHSSTSQVQHVLDVEEIGCHDAINQQLMLLPGFCLWTHWQAILLEKATSWGPPPRGGPRNCEKKIPPCVVLRVCLFLFKKKSKKLKNGMLAGFGGKKNIPARHWNKSSNFQCPPASPGSRPFLKVH